jgi:predicted nucleic acid-binding protein
MADAIVLATASREGAELVTSDIDLKGLPSVRFIPKK